MIQTSLYLMAGLAWMGMAGCSTVTKADRTPNQSLSGSAANSLVSQTEISQTEISPAETSPPAPQRYSREATLLAVGDIMMHGSQIKSGYDAKTKTYRYDQFFTEVQGILSQGNWVIGNLETTLAGPETGYTGYPMFNAPAPLATAIRDAGFNILTTANNHSLDRREAGLLKTLENVRANDLEPIGTDASAEAAKQIYIQEENGIKMAVLAYTYGTNGIPIPKGKDYLVALIDPPKMIADIQQAEAAGADVITVALHFGNEYQRQPSDQQKALVKQLIDAGADIILGSHPHVVQPYNCFSITNAAGETRSAVAIYSMGNFISNQRGDYKDLGVIFKVRLRKYFPDEAIEIVDIRGIPTWVHRYSNQDKYQFRILPIEAVLVEQNDSMLSSSQYSMLKGALTEMNQHLTSMTAATESCELP
ncbi:MAG: CapA family protein [Microcoleaceae cyanobacterium]